MFIEQKPSDEDVLDIRNVQDEKDNISKANVKSYDSINARSLCLLILISCPISKKFKNF